MQGELRFGNAGYFYATTTMLIWAGFVVVSRIGGQSELTVFDIAALRIGTAALVLSPWWVPRLLNPESRQLRWYQSLIVAVLAGIGFPLLTFVSMTMAPASHGAVLITGVLPFFTALLAFFLIGERPGRGRLAGLGLILLGVATLFVSNTAGSDAGSGVLLGDALLLAASLVWALFTVLIKRWNVRAFDVTLGVVATSALIYLPTYVVFLPKNIGEVAWSQSLLQAFFQGFMVVCVALWSYAKAAELLGAVRAVIFLSATPVMGVLLSVVILGEPMTTGILVGAVVTFLGALLGATASPGTVSEKLKK